MVESLTDFPSAILIEILARLPLKTLFASRCVCKTFLSLTTPDPYFTALHSSNVSQTLVFQFGDVFKPSGLLHFTEAELDVAPGFVEDFQLKPIFQMPKLVSDNASPNFVVENKFVLVNSCNGLLYCVRRQTWDERSLVCNPVTNEYIVIPDAVQESSLFSRTESMWLGFSPVTNQYKVLRIFSLINGDDEPLVAGAQVLVIGSSSWKYIHNDMQLWHDYSWDACSTCLNGAIYWLNNLTVGVCFFDFDREVFGDIALPPELGVDHLRIKHCMSIGVLEGCLCLTFSAYNAHHVDVWVMKKLSNQESWSKEFVVDTVKPIGRLVHVGFQPLHVGFKPLQVLKNGEILTLWKSNDLVCYDPRKKSLRYAGFHWLKSNPKAVAFTPSFTPLKDTLLVDKVMVQHMRPR